MRGIKYFFLLLRILIGALYMVSGVEKLLQPYENFLYVVQGYSMIHHLGLEQVVAWIFPWIEYFLGGFLLLGLWTRESLLSIGALSMVFIVAVGQAIVRKLPLTECGCFGDLVGMPLAATLVIDIVTLSLVILLCRFYDRGTGLWTLDRYWTGKKEQQA